jgi:small-conductance mechanosensitive channel
MELSSLQQQIQTWISGNLIQLVITAVILLVYLVLVRLTKPRLEEGGDQSNFKDSVAHKAINLARGGYSLVAILVLAVAWGFDFRSVAIFASTTITLLGVALFASWSLLSNVTAYMILLLHPAFKRGNFVRIIDVDNYAEGYIADLTLFNTKLLTENREVIMYPNSLLLGRPSLINPRDRLDGIGKLQQSQPADPAPSKI